MTEPDFTAIEAALVDQPHLTDDQCDIVIRIVRQFVDDNARHLAIVARNPTPTNDPTAREAELRKLAADHGLAVEETTDPNEDDPRFRTYAVMWQDGVETLDDGLTLDELAAFLAGYTRRR